MAQTVIKRTCPGGKLDPRLNDFYVEFALSQGISRGAAFEIGLVIAGKMLGAVPHDFEYLPNAKFSNLEEVAAELEATARKAALAEVPAMSGS